MVELEKTLGGDTKGMNERLENLSEEKRSQESKISDLNQQRKQCDVNIKKSINEISQLKNELSKKKAKSDDMKTKLQIKFKNLEENVKKFETSYEEFDLEALEAQLLDYEKKCENMKKCKSEKEDEIIDLGQQRSSFDIRESHLKDALELVKKQREMDEEKVIFRIG